MNFRKNAPLIETERLIIRLVSLDDVDAYFDFCSDEDVCRYLTFNPYTDRSYVIRSIKNMLNAYLNGTDVNFSIILKETNHVIGSISLTFNNKYNTGEIGYILNKKYWKNGYMNEALKAIMNISYDYYNLSMLKASYLEGNYNSAKLLFNNNFQVVEVINNGFLKNGRHYNLIKTVYVKNL